MTPTPLMMRKKIEVDPPFMLLEPRECNYKCFNKACNLLNDECFSYGCLTSKETDTIDVIAFQATASNSTWLTVLIDSLGYRDVMKTESKKEGLVLTLGKYSILSNPEKPYRLYPHQAFSRRIYPNVPCSCSICENLTSLFSNFESAAFDTNVLPLWENAFNISRAMVRKYRLESQKGQKDKKNTELLEKQDTDKKSPLKGNISIFTDASISTRRYTAGVAAVDTNLKLIIDAIPLSSAGDSLKSEEKAILVALKSWRNSKYKSITIYTDSLSSVKRISQARRGKSISDTQDILNYIKEHEDRGREVNILWVKGHDGNKYNEIADRLSRIARRTVEWKIPSAIAVKQVVGAVSDEMGKEITSLHLNTPPKSNYYCIKTNLLGILRGTKIL